MCFKTCFLLLFVFCGRICAAQMHAATFVQVERNAARRADDTNPEALSRQLTKTYHTEIEKVRAIFRWITENISYRTAADYRFARSGPRYASTDDTASRLLPLDEVVACEVLRNRSGVCNGYTRLFKTLCAYAGIRAEIINGYARGSRGSSAFRPNHSWNAVFVDSAWHLLDPTWASGYVSFTDEFVRQYDNQYFFPDPQSFIHTHYPEDLRWSLLPNPPVLFEFTQTPFKLTAFRKYDIATMLPAKGVVNAAVGDTLQFRLELQQLPSIDMAPELTSDSMLLGNDSTLAFIRPQILGNQVVYQYVAMPGVAWVHLVYNNDVVLRYRLKLRKPRT